MIAGWCSRTVRAAMFAAVCVLLAALGHVLMSGDHVPWWALATGAVLTGAVGWSLAGRERGLPLIVSVVVAAQTALHAGFSWAQPTGVPGALGSMGASSVGASGSAGASGAIGHMSHVGHADHVVPDLLGGSPAFASLASSSSGMIAAHLLAALLCGLWLAHGERALFGLLRATAGWLAAPLRLMFALPAPPRRPRPRVRRRRSDRCSLRRLLLVHAITLRGPPTGTAVIFD
ncbi:hypothetical protein ACWD4G_40760 [Streptomyces sp. NPDC002643]